MPTPKEQEQEAALRREFGDEAVDEDNEARLRREFGDDVMDEVAFFSAKPRMETVAPSGTPADLAALLAPPMTVQPSGKRAPAPPMPPTVAPSGPASAALPQAPKTVAPSGPALSPEVIKQLVARGAISPDTAARLMPPPAAVPVAAPPPPAPDELERMRMLAALGGRNG
jgi:hypothetical protein